MSAIPLPFPGVRSQEQQKDNIKNSLGGRNAFYNQPDYLKATKQDFSQHKPLPATYTWNTEPKIIRVAKQIFSVIIFPIGIYQLLHTLAGKILLPASSPRLFMGLSANHADDMRAEISLEGEWKYKRITIGVDGYKIDATIVGKTSTLNNHTWALFANGNGGFYEDKLAKKSHDFKQILNEINGNGIVFNYPGVGSSSGPPNRQAMAKAYRAMLAFLEDQENGIGAKAIIGYGHSIGGGVQGDALKTHELKKEIKYVFVKSRTFSDLSTTASILTIRPLGFLVKLLGWNMDSVESSKKLQAPEIIMQTAHVKGYEELTDSSKIIDDGVIPTNASLAKVLLDDHNCPREKKLFLGMKERHNDRLIDPALLAQKIETFLSV